MRSLALTLACLLSLFGSSFSATRIVNLPQFSVLHCSVPFNVLLRPSGGNAYRMVIDSSDRVRNAIKTDVGNSVLYFVIEGRFSVDGFVKVILEMPARKLRKIEKYGSNTLVVASSFQPDNFEILSRGTGEVLVSQIRTDRLLINAEERSSVFLKGPVQQAEINARRGAKLYLFNIQRIAKIKATGSSRVHISGPSRLKVEGETSGSARILSKGTRSCKVRNTSSFFSRARGCSRFSSRAIPRFNPAWTCGTVSGSTSTSVSVGGSSASAGGSASFGGSAGASGSFRILSRSSVSTNGGTRRQSSSVTGSCRQESIIGSIGAR